STTAGTTSGPKVAPRRSMTPGSRPASTASGARLQASSIPRRAIASPACRSRLARASGSEGAAGLSSPATTASSAWANASARSGSRTARAMAVIASASRCRVSPSTWELRRTAAAGLLSSWAMPAARVPNWTIRSPLTTWLRVCSHRSRRVSIRALPARPIASSRSPGAMATSLESERAATVALRVVPRDQRGLAYQVAAAQHGYDQHPERAGRPHLQLPVQHYVGPVAGLAVGEKLAAGGEVDDFDAAGEGGQLVAAQLR